MEKHIVKPSILPGFMELLPSDQIMFNMMMDTIRKNYEKFGFKPLDTPLIEKSEVLLAKGGGETDKQVYRFSKGDNDLSLRFDLTVPLARYVSQYMPSLTFPFRRYQIGKVYRGERNQRGRFREFYQCDIDIIGNGKLGILNDAEIPSIIYSTFRDLGFDAFQIHINNRKVLNGFFDCLNIVKKMEVMRIIDKIEKAGVESVKAELQELDIDRDSVGKIINFIGIKGSSREILNSLNMFGISNALFEQGLDELSKVVLSIGSFGVPEKNYTIDLSIARGLDYYTGTVYETILDDYPEIGSVCSGGRYDNLAEYYTTQKLPGVGISIGLTRLFYQLREAGFVANNSSTLTKVLVVPMEESSMEYAIKTAADLREMGIITELYMEDGKASRKLSYADKTGIPFVVLAGNDEIETGILTVKDMTSGEQHKLELKDVSSVIK